MLLKDAVALGSQSFDEFVGSRRVVEIQKRGCDGRTRTVNSESIQTNKSSTELVGI